MSAIICGNCGKNTNTIVCAWNSGDDVVQPLNKAKKCFAVFVGGKWVKGCAYDDMDNILASQKYFVNKLLGLPILTATPPAIFFDALELIRDIATNYDGYGNVENLKSLIDELREIAEKALKGEPIEMIPLE